MKEQIDSLCKLLQSSSPTVNPSSLCSLAQKGNYLTISLYSVKPNLNCPWIIDSGATDHMTRSSKLFSLYGPCARKQKIKIANGSFSAIVGKGSIVISPSITLHNVLHVPNLSCNLLSVSKITHDLKCQALFHSSCAFQDLDSGKTISSAKQSGGLHFFEDGSELEGQTHTTCFKPLFTNKIMLWHFRLGHPNFQYLKYMFPNLFLHKNPSSFQCEICELAQHRRSPFPLQPYKPCKPFSSIHSDVWGPTTVTTLSRKKWFITFINDHTKITWVYLLREKSDVEQVFKKKFNMVQT